jgi:uncharacterized protein YraI
MPDDKGAAQGPPAPAVESSSGAQVDTAQWVYAMHLKHLSLALGLLLASAGIATAAPAQVTSDLRLRSGPGTNYPVVASLPAGATVDVHDCGASWCRVMWGARQGFVSRVYLAMGGGGGAYPTYVEGPPVVYETGPVYAWGPGWGWGWGGGWRGGWGGGWHGGWRR